MNVFQIPRRTHPSKIPQTPLLISRISVPQIYSPDPIPLDVTAPHRTGPEDRGYN